MKKIITLSLSAALITSAASALPASAETVITNPSETSIPMKLAEVKDGQFNEKGEAYFTLTIEQEGYYRLVGDKTRTYETAITTDQAQLENAEFQAASKLRMLKKGTYYVKVKGLPNTTYHFKFAERIFDMDKEWPASTWKSEELDFPYYTERKATNMINLTDDKYIYFLSHTYEHSDAVEAISLKNTETGETYKVKKIASTLFTSYVPNGQYEVRLVLTDAFIKNPYVGKMRLKYKLLNHFPLNTTVSSPLKQSSLFTLTTEKDTKINFTLIDPKGKKGNNQRFSLYDEQHRLVKRVHIPLNESSRSFTYTVKKGHYKLAISNNLELNTSTETGANLTSKFKLKNNTLVYRTNGKIVKGYRVYKEKLYKDGKLTTGRIKYGKAPNMKLYRNGIIEKELYITKDYKYAFKDGVLIKGTYKQESQTGLDLIFKDGILSHYIELKNDRPSDKEEPKLYDNGKLYKGNYVLSSYQYQPYDEPTSSYLRLFINGKLATGYKKAMYKGETYLFKNGVAGDGEYGYLPFYYNGKVYVAGKPSSKYVTIDDKLYYKHKLFTGEKGDRYYKDGIHHYYLVTKKYEDKIQEATALKMQVGQQSNEVVATLLKEKVAEVLSYLDNKKGRIYDDYGHTEYDDVGSAKYETPLNIPYTIKKQLEDIDSITKQLDGAAEETHILLQQRIKDTYKQFDLYYENGALLDGEYEGNLYEEGKLLGALLNIAYHKTGTSFLNYDYKRIVSQKDELAIKAQLQDYIDAATKRLQAANTILKASQDPDYPKVNLYTDSATEEINNSLSTFRFIKNIMNSYEATANLTNLQDAMTEGFTLIGKNITFNEVDSEAVYQDIKLLEVQDGAFDDKGYAYFKVNLTEPAGNYTFAGNNDINSYTTFAASTPNKLNISQQLGGKEIRYLEKGMHYIAVKGQPNGRYHFKMQRRTYNVETMRILTPALREFDRANVAKVPIYQTKQPSVPMQLTTNQYIQFLALPSDYRKVSDTLEVINALELKNEQTGQTYTAKKLSAYRFALFAPNGTYRVSLKSARPSIGQHVALRYFLSPTLELNKPFSSSDGVRNKFTFIADKEMKMQFTLSDEYTSSEDQTFKLYNANDELVKKMTLKKGEKTRIFTFNVKKGNYYARLDGNSVHVTATAK